MVTTSLVKELREQTGAGVMECKRALVETNGDLKKATDFLKQQGLAKAEKRAGRDASQGLVIIESVSDKGAMIELNCETDFVARTDGFQMLARRLAMHALTNSPIGVTLEAFVKESLDGKTIEQLIQETSGTTGEAMTLKRVAKYGQPAGVVGAYRHHNSQVGVLVEITGAADDSAQVLANEIALHIASADPIAVNASDIPADTIARERRIAEDQVAQEGKPEAIRAKIVEGKVKKFASERALLEQPFVKDESMTIAKMIANVPGAVVTRFARFKVGEV